VGASAEDVIITFIESSGIEKVAAAKIGESLMVVATNNMVVGIDGDCGGSCACGTCRIFADVSIPSLLKDPEEMELDMLEFAADGDLGQRLACQIAVTKQFDGIKIKVVE
jgi:2Fe-2S ferredoxin